jgi:hypothetical protein
MSDPRPEVDDVSETIRRVSEHPLKMSFEAVVDEGVLAGWRWVYFEDPDGYPLELVEVAYYNADERRKGIAAYLASRSQPQPA